eukprot:6034241-Prymnesium_polylepis.1
MPRVAYCRFDCCRKFAEVQLLVAPGVEASFHRVDVLVACRRAPRRQMELEPLCLTHQITGRLIDLVLRRLVLASLLFFLAPRHCRL